MAPPIGAAAFFAGRILHRSASCRSIVWGVGVTACGMLSALLIVIAALFFLTVGYAALYARGSWRLVSDSDQTAIQEGVKGGQNIQPKGQQPLRAGRSGTASAGKWFG